MVNDGSPVSQQRVASPAARPRIEGDRETEILDATLDLVASSGYDRLSMDAVAVASKASKATLYRRWSTKADLVIDALQRASSAPQVCDVDTGSLRGDLLASACAPRGLTDDHPLAVMASVVTALHHDEEFARAFQRRFLAPKLATTRAIYERARNRGELPHEVDLDLITPVLAAVVLHRVLILRQPVDEPFVTKVVDEIVLPAATRGRSASRPGAHRTSPNR